MPLIKNTLEPVLEEAFSKAMEVFIESVKASPAGTDVSENARNAAAKVFAQIATDAIDSYIKSATIIVQPGQIVTAASAAGPVTGATTSPSSPATIS
jgi:hypothetical protein